MAVGTPSQVRQRNRDVDMKPVMLFSELEPDKKNLPKLKECTNILSADLSKEVADYLENGIVAIDVMERVKDPLRREGEAELTDSSLLIGGSSLWTDGEWYWRQDLAYFVRNYRVRIPREFIQKTLSSEVPEEPPRDLFGSWIDAILLAERAKV